MAIPNAMDDIGLFSVSEDDVLKVNPSNSVLDNDTDTDGDGLAASITGNPQNPLFDFKTNGTFTYDARYHGVLYIDTDGTDPTLSDMTDGDVTLTNGFDSLGAGAIVYDTFTYEANDGQDGDEATVSVMILGENDDPDAVDDAVEFDQDTTDNVSIDVVFNDTDVDIWPTADKLDLEVIGIADIADEAGPAGGSDNSLGDGLMITTDTGGTVQLDAGTGELVYTAAEGFFGIDTFEYTVSDGNGGEDTGVVRVTVLPGNEAPDAVDDTRTISEDAGETSMATVLGNDTDVDDAPLIAAELSTDIGSALTRVDDMGNPIAGNTGILVDFNADGTFDYDPNAEFESLGVGETAYIEFDYIAYDGEGASDSATVTIEVQGQNDGPNGSNGSATVYERGLSTGTQPEPNTIPDSGSNSDIVQTIDLNISDPDTNDMPFLSSTSAAMNYTPGDEIAGLYGTLAINNDGTVTYTLTGSAEHDTDGVTEQEMFTVYVLDGNGGSKALTVTIDVKDDSPYLGNSPVADEASDNDVEGNTVGAPVSFSSDTNNTTSDTFDYFEGADEATLSVTAVPARFMLYDSDPDAPGGEVYVDSVYDPMTQTVTGTIDGGTLDDQDLYTLVLNDSAGSNTGSYQFTMLLDPPSDLLDLDFDAVSAGAPQDEFIFTNLGNLTFDGGSGSVVEGMTNGQTSYNLGASFNTEAGDGDYRLNPNSGGGFGMGDGNIEINEVIEITNINSATTTGFELDVTGNGGGVQGNDPLDLVWEAWDTSVVPPVLIDSGRIDLTQMTTTDKTVEDVAILPSGTYDTLYLAFDGVDNNDKLRINNFQTLTTIEVDDFDLDFTLAAGEDALDGVDPTGDGDVADGSPASFTIYVDGTDEDSVFSIV
ncbi:Ig-like domain-containing protein [Ruegeria lacuscaerulensis]|uniref:Ig-like domain-containing protein n=1 Tax=Ruegeria lacuscaerulensis TaxID=55218 RepID=UPI00147B5FB6|nr:Ig-like domain-containing protein [Ruegeria lacuscaerulensis]